MPHLRGHKNRTDDYFMSHSNREKKTRFAQEQDSKDVDMKDTEPKPHPTSKAVEYAAEQQERPTRKHRMVEKLTPDAQKVL